MHARFAHTANNPPTRARTNLLCRDLVGTELSADERAAIEGQERVPPGVDADDNVCQSVMA